MAGHYAKKAAYRRSTDAGIGRPGVRDDHRLQAESATKIVVFNVSDGCRYTAPEQRVWQKYAYQLGIEPNIHKAKHGEAPGQGMKDSTTDPSESGSKHSGSL